MSQSRMLVMTYVVEVVGVGIAEDLNRCSHGRDCERRVDFVILAQFPDRQSRNRKTYRPFYCATCRERVPPWDRPLAVVAVDVGIWLVELGHFSRKDMVVPI
jgi:hypothetical protein